MASPEFPLKSLAIMGVGLIGGSIALAAKEFSAADEVIGIGRNEERLQAAQRLGVIDRYITDVSELKQADLVVVCTPVDRIAMDISDVLRLTSEETLVTDAGSVKSAINETLKNADVLTNRFLGSHPIAGSHLAGFENAQGRLFEDRVCVVCPDETTPASLTHLVTRFWQQIGMQVKTLSAEEHDRILALTSHLPHLAAAAVAQQISDAELEYASTGFRDTTRVAAGDPDLWTAIFSSNSEQMVNAIDQLISSLEEFRNDLIADERSQLRKWLKAAQEKRALLP